VVAVDEGDFHDGGHPSSRATASSWFDEEDEALGTVSGRATRPRREGPAMERRRSRLIAQ
jgi:hypothetical protein